MLRSAALISLSSVLALTFSLEWPISPRILGGDEVEDIESFPWMLSLQVWGVHRCGASIIGDRWALTAAHCVAGSSGPADLSLRAGTVSRELAGWVIGVDLIKAHPEAKLWRNDIALLRVPRDFPFGTKVQAVALAESGITPGYSATVTGWGRTNLNDSFSWWLLNTTVTVSTSGKCEKDFGFNITSDILCARPKTPSTDICEGDGGGALTKNRILYGIVIYGRCLGDVSQNSLYVNVSYFYNWIKEATALEPL